MLLLVLVLAQAPIELQAGMIITQSVQVVPKTYRLTGAPIIVRGNNITIDFRGATRQLTLRANDLSDNWKPRLFSLIEHESLVDWLSFHHNDKDEWLRFGAAIYLQDVQGATVRGNTVLGGMNGLLLVRTAGALIRDNNFSFNS